MAYEGWPIETDPSALAEDAYEFLTGLWPEWLPSPANFDAGSIEAHARMIAELRDVAARMPDEAFLRFGPLAGVPPVEATYAVATATLTAIDTQGYTLEAGTVFGVRSTGDTLYRLQVVSDVVIPPASAASAAGEVDLIAEDTGPGSDGLTGSLELVDRTLPWFLSLVIVDAPSGGQDAETVQAYLNRLAEELQLSAPRPILPRDFEAFARRDPDVDRAVAINLYRPGLNEIQRITSGLASGTFTITYSGQTTAGIAFGANAATVQAALEALSNLAPGDVSVTALVGPPIGTTETTFVVARGWDIEFTGTLASTNIAEITTSSANLFDVTTLRNGSALATTVEKYVTLVVVDSDGLDPGLPVRLRVQADIEGRRELNFEAPVIAAGYDTVSVEVEGECYPGEDPEEVRLRVVEALEDFLSPADWGVPPFSEDRLWYQDDLVRLSEVAEVVNRVDGFWRITGPGANGLPEIEGAAANYTLADGGAPVVLPLAGTITVVVTAAA